MWRLVMKRWLSRFPDSQRGQVIYLVPVILVVVAVLVGVMIDMGIYVARRLDAESDAATACVVAVEANRRPGDPNAWQAFSSSLDSNEVPVDAYSPVGVAPTSQDSPREGTGKNLTKGLEYQGDGSWRTAISWQEPTHFLGLVGIGEFGVWGRARCIERAGGGLSPIAVRESAIPTPGTSDPDTYTILGEDPDWDLADIESGTNFRGAVFLHMWCRDPDGVGLENCPSVRVFYPLTEEPPSAQTQKKLVDACFKGINCSIWPPSAEHLPIVSGTTAKELCKSALEAGWKVGDLIYVIIFNGEVYDPDPGYSNWENVRVEYYAEYKITEFLPAADKSCNHMKAQFQQTYDDISEIPTFNYRSREISWEYEGAIP
jgi:hypothetical protein